MSEDAHIGAEILRRILIEPRGYGYVRLNEDWYLTIDASLQLSAEESAYVQAILDLGEGHA